MTRKMLIRLRAGPLYAWTDYPLRELGDMPFLLAPIRRCIVLDYDGKYCTVKVGGVYTTVKAGYIYKRKRRFIP